MTQKEACKILGIEPGAKKTEIKKKYHRLMLQVHPDVEEPVRMEYAYSAQEINLAYEFLMKARKAGREAAASRTDGTRRREKETAWDAPVNPHAYASREILHTVEDADGVVLGNFRVAKGKYLWTPEEDFPLFLLSLYRCGKELLDGVDDDARRGRSPDGREWFQSELTYLLAQQFIDGGKLLGILAKKTQDRDGNLIFYLPAMLELTEQKTLLQEGEELLPAGVRRHRLYVKDRREKELGYLSFRDDRLYYVVIPLFEQRRLQVRMRTAAPCPKGKKKRTGYQDLRLWVRLCQGETDSLSENLNLRIEALLKEYSMKETDCAKVTTVLFDLDGTLLPMDQDVFIGAYFKHLAAGLAPAGYDPKKLADSVWAGTGAMIGNDGRRTNEEVFWERFEHVYGKSARSDLPLFEEFYRTRFNRVAEVCGKNPMAAELIGLLKQNRIRLVLATNPVFPAVATRNRIRWAGLEPEDFSFYTTYENTGYCKPNPEYYRDILQRIGCGPAECLMVGNDVTEDMVAQTLGMRVFLLTDCLINREGTDISVYPNGGFPQLFSYIRTVCDIEG